MKKKKEQIDTVEKSFVIISIAARHWKQSQVSLLRFLYNKSPNRKFDIYYWLKRLNNVCYERKINSTSLNEFYITMSKYKAWAVNLPVALKIKPKTKYFFFKTFNYSKEQALCAAIDYRNAKLNKWLLMDLYYNIFIC